MAVAVLKIATLLFLWFFSAESVALDTLKNAIRGFENAGVIHCYSEASVAMIALTEEYYSEELLFTFIRRLESYRE